MLKLSTKNKTGISQLKSSQKLKKKKDIWGVYNIQSLLMPNFTR